MYIYTTSDKKYGLLENVPSAIFNSLFFYLMLKIPR